MSLKPEEFEDTSDRPLAPVTHSEETETTGMSQEGQDDTEAASPVSDAYDPPFVQEDYNHIDQTSGSMNHSDLMITTEEAPPEPSGWTIAKAVIREIVETVVLTLIIFFLIQTVIRNFRVDGHSMDPNLSHGEYLVVDKISYKLPFQLREPQRGDVVVFEPPTQPDKDFVKRIVGLPGETIEIRQGQIFINQEHYDEPFAARIDRSSMSPRVIPDGEYFVMGDNRGNSNDSRNWGSLGKEKFVGRAWLSYWPPESWGVIPNDGPTSAATLFGLFHE